MGSHPIENIMQTTMENIRNMVDVNTIVGDTVVMADGTVIIPISKVSFGFVAGGGEYSGNTDRKDKERGDSQSGRSGDYPFAGGTGAGVSLSPMAFLVVNDGEVNLLPVQFSNSGERMLELIPDVVCQLKELFGGGMRSGKKDEPEKGRKESWFSKNHRGKFDEDDAVDETYRPAKDEL